MVDWVCHAEGRSIIRRAMPMRTRLYPMSDRMCILVLRDVTNMDVCDVDAWFEAIDMSPEERQEAFRQILSEGRFIVCNIEHRLEICCHSR